jgi:hypothetical protein
LQSFGNQLGHEQGIFHPLPPGAGVGVTRIDHNRLRHARAAMLDANLDWRSTNLVRRKHTGHGRRQFRHEQPKMAFLTLLRSFACPVPFDVADDAAGVKTLGGDNTPWDSFEAFYHNRMQPLQQSGRFLKAA